MSETSGVKFDEGKPDLSMIPFDVITDLTAIYSGGAVKYGRDNWKKGMSWGRVFSACLRHLFKFWLGEENDPEWGKSHLLHALWNIIALYWYKKHGVGEDDRSVI